MRTRDSGLRLTVAVLGIALLAGALAALAQATNFDFTGHWRGSATDKKGNVTPLTADFTSSGAKFTGTLSAQVTGGGTLQCTAHGKEKPNQKVKIRLKPCGDHSVIVLHGTLDTATQTVAGKYARVKHGKVHPGTFTLTKGSSPMGAFVDDPDRLGS